MPLPEKQSVASPGSRALFHPHTGRVSMAMIAIYFSSAASERDFSFFIFWVYEPRTFKEKTSVVASPENFTFGLEMNLFLVKNKQTIFISSIHLESEQFTRLLSSTHKRVSKTLLNGDKPQCNDAAFLS